MSRNYVLPKGEFKIPEKTPPDFEAEIASLKDQTKAVIKYTDLSFKEIVSGNFEPKNTLAANYTVHMNAIRLMELLGKFLELKREG